MQHTNRSRLDEANVILMVAIGVLAVIVINLFRPAPWVWLTADAILLAALALLLGLRMMRVSGSKFDEINLLLLLPIVLLAMSMASSVVTALAVVRGGAVLLLAILGVLLGIRMFVVNERKLDVVNLVLLGQIGVLTFFIVYRSHYSPWVRLGETGILLVALASVLRLCRKRMPGRSEGVMLWLAAVGITLVVVLGFLFPITQWWPSWLNLREWPDVRLGWAWFEWSVLRPWSDVRWFRWGLVALLVAVLATLIGIRVRRQ